MLKPGLLPSKKFQGKSIPVVAHKPRELIKSIELKHAQCMLMKLIIFLDQLKNPIPHQDFIEKIIT